MIPFLRWAGGKRWLAAEISPVLRKILEETKGKYIEPFLGAGAMFFSVAPKRSIISDLNQNLIETYLAISENWYRIQNIMQSWEVNKETYYKVRQSQSKCPFTRAAKFVWLNRTCYGGLYRENKKGQFNVPYGGGDRTPDSVYKQNLLFKASQIINKNIKLECTDFKVSLDQAGRGDIIYCDPTYSNVTRDQFDRYGANIFSWQDQIRLAIASEKAMSKGAIVIISNGYFEDLVPLYPQAYRLIKSKTKSIGNRPSSSNKALEYLMILDPKKRRHFWKKLGNIENKRIGSKRIITATSSKKPNKAA